MHKYFIVLLGLCLIYCSDPTQSSKSYYDDLSKGTDSLFTANEQGIIDAIIKFRDSCVTDDIIIISDSTIDYGFDTSRLASDDTFPDTLLQMLEYLNDKSYYIGDCLLDISADYRYWSSDYSKSMCNQNSCTGFWGEFYARFPKSKHGIVSFSKIAINSDSTKALANVLWVYGSLGADGGVMSFIKHNGIWTAIDYVIMIVS